MGALSTCGAGRPSLLLAASLVALGCAELGCRRSDATSTPSEPEDAIEVETAEVREKAMPRSIALTGTLRGEEEAELASPTSGLAVDVRFARSSEVKAGEVLVQLDMGAASLSAAEAWAQAQNANVQLDSAERDAKRAAKLKQGGAISQAEYDRMSSQLEVARLAARAAKARAALGQKSVSDGVVRAPFSGLISERYVDPGEFLMPGARVATLVAIDRLRLEVLVPEAHLAAVTGGAEVSFRVAAYPERRFTAVVRRLGPVVRAATRDAVVEAEVENADRALKPGMFATIELAMGEANMPVLPLSSLVAHDERRHVFVVHDGRLEERVVSIGPAAGDDVAVLRGLAAGDRVVRKPDASLRNGQRVR